VAIQSIVQTAVTDEALQAAYDARFKDTVPVRPNTTPSHILVATQEAADKLKADLAAGADFAELAKANSTDTGSGAERR
jgi:peptidyl-prolyl cis-trans isomerase C